MTKREILIREIIARSVAKSWEDARREWDLVHVYESDEAETCLCTHYPIVELCELGNRLNRAHVTVGNCCVKNFLGLPSERIFQGVKRVRANDEKALNQAAVAHAHKSGWINDWEREFCLDTMRKRVLSPKQMAKRVEINRRVLQRMKRRPTPSLI